MNNHHDQPQFAPVTELPKLGPHLDGMLEAAEEQLRNLEEARPKPHVLDDSTVNRVKKVYGAQRNDLPLFDELLRRWSAEPDLSEQQRTEITRLQGQMTKLHEVVTEILNLADELAQGTIDKIMAMSNEELGLRALLGDLPGQRYQATPTFRQPNRQQRRKGRGR